MIRTVLRNARPIMAVVFTIAGLSACGDSTAPPEERVATLTQAAGDEQQAAVATALPQPIVARALDLEGRPVAGARVVWTVSTGAGSLAPGAEVTDQDGRAQAVWTLGTAAGEQTATAMIGFTVSAVFRATAVAGPAASLVISPDAVLLDAIGGTQQLTVVARDAHNNTIEGRAPTWLSLDTDIVTVSTGGEVTAVMPGTARVRATLDAATDELDVMVTPQVAMISVTPATPTLSALGSTVQMQATGRDSNGNEVPTPAQDFSWSSASTAVVSVNATGLATAQSNGTAEIRATLGSVTGQTIVTVSQVATSIIVTPATDTLNTAGPTVQLNVQARDANARVIPSPTVDWASSNIAIARVSATGLVTAVANGIALISGSSGTASDTSIITVRLNTAPKPLPDTLGATRDQAMSVAAPGVLTNDTLGIPAGTVASFGGGSLAGSVTANDAGETVTFGTGGSLRVNANGSVEFTPSAGFTGNFTFQYRVANSVGTADATVTIRVGIGPAAVDDLFTTAAGVTLDLNAASGVLANDDVGFPEGEVVSFGGGSLAGTVTRYSVGTIVAPGAIGQIRLRADGSLRFVPAVGFTGTVTFLYRVRNSAGSSDATVTIDVTVPPPAPGGGQ
jgi:hypothetical protein